MAGLNWQFMPIKLADLFAFGEERQLFLEDPMELISMVPDVGVRGLVLGGFLKLLKAVRKVFL